MKKISFPYYFGCANCVNFFKPEYLKNELFRRFSWISTVSISTGFSW
jgi:hypothetical protein